MITIKQEIIAYNRFPTWEGLFRILGYGFTIKELLAYGVYPCQLGIPNRYKTDTIYMNVPGFEEFIAHNPSHLTYYTQEVQTTYNVSQYVRGDTDWSWEEYYDRDMIEYLELGDYGYYDLPEEYLKHYVYWWDDCDTYWDGYTYFDKC